jgi:two-component system, NtrC family, response regulator AtoC
MYESTEAMTSGPDDGVGGPARSKDELDLRQFLTIVLADDDEDFREMLADVLRDDGYRVIEVRDGTSLLSGMSRGTFDGVAVGDNHLVVTDQRMPRMDGLRVVQSLLGRGRSLRFVLLTAFSEPELRAEAVQLGALAVIEKPLDLQDFRRLLALVTRRFVLH